MQCLLYTKLRGRIKLKKVNNFKYPGAVVKENGGMDMEIRHRVSATW